MTVKDHVLFLLELTKANAAYSEKQQSGRSSEKTLINLAWKVKELTDLNESGRGLLRKVVAMVDLLTQQQQSLREENVPRRLAAIRKELSVFVKRVTRHQRTAATHLLVFMISCEERKKKPYALPVQCLPYKGLSDGKARELANKVIEKMTNLNMKVAGL